MLTVPNFIGRYFIRIFELLSRFILGDIFAIDLKPVYPYQHKYNMINKYQTGGNLFQMTAEILATGEEIRTGATIDSNSAYIAQKLEETGVHITRHHSVGDEIEAIVSVLKEMGARADIAVVTGGLGPTTDDITTEAAAKAADTKLLLDDNALKSVENYFKMRNRPMSPSNRKQALLPQGAQCLFNPIGTAPGFLLKIDKCRCFFLPGVPAEMKRMLIDTVVPSIRKLQGDNQALSLTKTITTFGLTESAAGDRLAGFDTRFPEIKLGFRVQFPEIHIKFYLRGQDEPALERLIARASDWVTEKIGEKVLSIDGHSMETVIAEYLNRKQATVAVAESCTGGLISHWLTNVPGSSNFFLFSGVTYANSTKTDVLGVSTETLNRFGAVHEETVKEMATGIRHLTNATYGLATSGIAGPDGGTAEKPVGTVCIGLATPDTVTSRRLNYNFGDRLRHKRVFAMAALDLLRKEIRAEG